MSFLNWPLYEGLPQYYSLMFVFIGALFGSFFNVLALRWGRCQIRENDLQSQMWLRIRGQNIKVDDTPIAPLMGGRSQCPHCQTPIPIYRNIPLVSWILQRGKSACCNKAISPRYLAFEMTGAALFALVAWSVGPTMYGLVLGLGFMIMVLIALVDFTDGFIPDGLLIALTVIIYALSTHVSHWHGVETTFIYHVTAYLGITAVFAAASRIAGKEAIGGSDKHLVSLAAGFLGAIIYPALVLIVIALLITSSLMKSGVIERGLFTHMIDKSKSVPAGPSICLAMLIGAFCVIHGVTS